MLPYFKVSVMLLYKSVMNFCICEYICRIHRIQILSFVHWLFGLWGASVLIRSQNICVTPFRDASRLVPVIVYSTKF